MNPTAAAPRPFRRVLGERMQRPAWQLGLLALWLVLTAGTRALLLPDEGRYVGVAYAMLRGDALVPALHGLPFFHKPPLTYWVDAAAMWLLGVNELSARAAPLLGALAMAAAIVYDVRRVFGPSHSSIALLALATMPLFYFGGQYANHDMLVAGLITVAIVAGRRASEDGASKRWTITAWGAAALAVLTKGLIGVVLPALVLLPWLAWRRQWKAVLRLLHPAGLAAFALLVAPWFLAMQWRYPAFADYFFIEQHVRRYAQGGFNNVEPFWFYLLALPLLTLPWSLALLAPRRLLQGAGHERRAWYLWWSLVVVAFFSLPQSKLVGYVLPALGPWAALLALALADHAVRRRWALALGAGACLAVAAGVAWHGPTSHRDVGRALAARLTAEDRVVFVDDAFFDVPFYAHLQRPPVVLADWNAPGFASRDDWRKELRDAARFDPAAGARVLWPLERTAELACGAPRIWWVARHDWQPPAAIGTATRTLQGQHATLWQSTGRTATPCP